jgi:hypothetical protein
LTIVNLPLRGLDTIAPDRDYKIIAFCKEDQVRIYQQAVACFSLAVVVACNPPWDADRVVSISSATPQMEARPQTALTTGEFRWADQIEPDFAPVVFRVCRASQSDGYMRWDGVVSLRNEGGDKGLRLAEAPVDIVVGFDGSRPYGRDPSTGEPMTLAEHNEALLSAYPEQHWMTVPRSGRAGGAAFVLYFLEEGPGGTYRRVPTNFSVTLDQFVGNNPPGGTIRELNELNNRISVEIVDYDLINGHTGTFARSCWYASGDP